MTINTDRMREAFRTMAEPPPGFAVSGWTDLTTLCNAAIEAAEEIDRLVESDRALRALLAEARDRLPEDHDNTPFSEDCAYCRCLARIDAALHGEGSPAHVEWESGAAWDAIVSSGEDR